ncbi:siderophore-interacting protein [Aurantiacibacter poecillastricola]|uniref:siderophore-interacting protein n=1 Tax=Aurantiacibacter poecillastricola TaxID=3064385 RepID=UPI00273DA1C5|nr:siderophore-interacting protein [Aurantiacibacter sp. 219JJ12-13]MDP5260776.1 siderophore-interacting protein [Aurantiacibacter sp. 219JJ12-13]
MASRPAPRTMTVIAKRKVSPSMLRVTLGGEGMVDYPPDQQGGYVKLRLAPLPGKDKPTVRTYTIRAQREGEMDVDFVLHETPDGSHGPATDWALAAEPGTVIDLGGPGPAKPLPEGMDFYLIAGDMTALPAISVNLEALPRDAKGIAVLEVQDDADRQDLAAPEGVEIRWLVNPQPGTQPDLLAGALRDIAWPQGDVHAWAACEFSSMKALRGLLREERGLGPDRLYISSYWKSGLDEDNHKLAKREDAEAV